MSALAEAYWRDAAERFKSMTPDEAERYVRSSPDFRGLTESERYYWRLQIAYARRLAGGGTDG